MRCLGTYLRAIPAVAFWLLADATLLACPICFRVEENATTDGVQAAVVVLVGVTTCVLGAFAAFVVRFARREMRASEIPDSSCPELPASRFQIQ